MREGKKNICPSMPSTTEKSKNTYVSTIRNHQEIPPKNKTNLPKVRNQNEKKYIPQEPNEGVFTFQTLVGKKTKREKITAPENIIVTN